MKKSAKATVVGFSLVGVVLIIMAVFALQPKAKNAATSTSTDQGTKKVDTNAKLESIDEVVGTGAEAKVDANITVKYTGKLADGTVFDSTEKQGGTPATFQLSQGRLIDGWVQGIPGMKVGGKRKLVIPPALGYGDRPNGSIPANSTLTFEIELIDVK